MDSFSEQSERIWTLLGELKGQLSTVHQAIEIGAAGTLDRLNQQSSRIEKESEKIERLTTRVQELENKYSKQSGGFSLAGWAAPLMITLFLGFASIAVTIYSVHVNNSQEENSSR